MNTLVEAQTTLQSVVEQQPEEHRTRREVVHNILSQDSSKLSLCLRRLHRYVGLYPRSAHLLMFTFLEKLTDLTDKQGSYTEDTRLKKCSTTIGILGRWMSSEPALILSWSVFTSVSRHPLNPQVC